jgi:hypothetical protein
MSALKQAAAALARVQEDLERAAEWCGVAARHADDVFQAATTMGSTPAIGDAEDIKATVAVLRQQLRRALSTACVTAGTVRTVMHGGSEGHQAGSAAVGLSDEKVAPKQ